MLSILQMYYFFYSLSFSTSTLLHIHLFPADPSSPLLLLLHPLLPFPLSHCVLVMPSQTFSTFSNFPFTSHLFVLFVCLFFFTAIHLFLHIVTFPYPVIHSDMQLRSGETAAIVARELAEQTKGLLHPGDVPSTVRAMVQLVELLDVQLRNLTPGGKDSAARSLTKVLS